MIRIGDKVKRAGGSYEFNGVVIGEGTTSLGKRMLMVEHSTEMGMVHVFGEADLVPRPEDGDDDAPDEEHAVVCCCPQCIRKLRSVRFTIEAP